MSAFMVSIDCMHNVIVGLRAHDEHFRKVDPDMLGMCLFELNRRAVEAAHPRFGRPEAPEYRYREPMPRVDLLMQIYKSLSCLLYQCNAGDIIDDPVWLRMAKIELQLARCFGRRGDGSFEEATAQAAYDRCKWG